MTSQPLASANSADPPVLVSADESRVVTLTLNRAGQRNALNRDTVRALNEALDWAVEEEMRAVVITGAPPAFSAGGDLRGYQDLYRDAEDFKAFLREFHEVNEKLETSTLLSVAAVNGVCVAGGLELVLACDLVVVARSARVGDAHIGTWQLPGAGGSQRLVRQAGVGVAKRLLLTGALLDAEDAVACGIATMVADDEEIVDQAVALARRVADAPRETVREMKRLIRMASDSSLEDGLQGEMAAVAAYTAIPDGPAYRGLLRFFERANG